MIFRLGLKRALLLAVSFLLLFDVKLVYASNIKIDAVFLGQTHLSQPDYPYFNLTANRPALLKVHVVSEDTIGSPRVIAKVTHLNGDSDQFDLNGPDMLPHSESLPSTLGEVTHSYNDSFTGILPKEWVQPGMEITITADEATYNKKIKVGASNPLFLHMYDFHFFDRGQALANDYNENAFIEMASKLPISTLTIERVRDVRFPNIVVPAQPNLKTPHLRVSSPRDYENKTGTIFKDWKSIAMMWLNALSEANGNANLTMMYGNIIGVNSIGASESLKGVGMIADHSSLLTVFGYGLGLKNWQEKKNFPYRGRMYGILAQKNHRKNGKKLVHVGPVWGYDMNGMRFISPVVQYGRAESDIVGRYKREPMEAGGVGDQDKGFIFRHFSDFSVREMQKYLEDNLLILSEDGDYYKWDSDSLTYSKDVKGEIGIDYPYEIFSDVISLIVSASLADRRVNMVYPPIGPYKGNLIDTYDPNKEKDRESANKAKYCSRKGCDFTLKVVQGKKTKFYMLPISSSEGDDRYNPDTLATKAVNIRATNATIDQVLLYHTPDANIAGMGDSPEFLHGWVRNVPKK